MFKKSRVACTIAVSLALSVVALFALPVSAAVTPIFQENFDSNLNNWTITSGSPVTTTAQLYRGNGSLLLNYTDPSVQVMLQHNMAPVSNVLVRVFFYDNMDTSLGSMFEVKTSGSLTTPGPHIGLGVRTNITTTGYTIRISDGTTHNHYDTGLKRTTGWHMFEVIVTPSGSYAKIDNEFISAYSNPGLVAAGSIDFVATWGQEFTGQSYYDELVVMPANNEPWQTQFYAPLATHTNTYLFSTTYSPLCGGAENTWTSIDTATAVYRYGKFINNATVWNRGLTLYKNTVNSIRTVPTYDSCDTADTEWFRGMTGSALAYATRIMWSDLDLTTQNTAKNTLSIEAGKYIKAFDDFEKDLSGWTVTSPPPNSVSIVSSPVHMGAKSVQLALNDPNSTISIIKSVKFITSTGHDNSSGYARAWFYDDMDQTLGTVFGVKASDQTGNAIASTSLGVNTNTSPSNYIFRYKVGTGSPQFVDTGIARSAGWHRFELFVNNWGDPSLRGTSARIDSTLISTRNPYQTQISSIEIVSSWNVTGTATYDDVFVSRMPESGFSGDTKAEENAWHADFLAAITNFFPDVLHQAELEWLGRCYAWHSITTSADQYDCGIKTQTVHDDWHLENHGRRNPTYALSALRGLGRGGMSYVITGKAIPTEFRRNNVGSLYSNFILPHLDTATYQFNNLTDPLDWCGATNSGYLGVVGYHYVRYLTDHYDLNTPLGFTFNDMMAKRSLFYYDISSDYVKNPVTQVPPGYGDWDPGIRCQTRNRESYDWKLNTNFAGNDYAIASYLFP